MSKGENTLRSFKLRPTSEEEKGGLEELSANSNPPGGSEAKVLGIGFTNDEIILSLSGLDGKILEKETIDCGLLKKFKGKVKEFNAIVDEVSSKSAIKDSSPELAGVAMPISMEQFNPRGAEVLSDGFKKIFGCDVIIGSEATAAAYGERNAGDLKDSKAVLYMHSDIGTGIVLKKETIYESHETQENYMRPWEQFGIVRTAKELVDKGIGTDIVNMVDGNLDEITVEVVLKAASNKDELAEDLVRRAGLALGVRVAYLANMFNAPKVIVGGGVENKEGNFVNFVAESAQRFLTEDVKKGFEVSPGVLGKDASSVGAALLCRREIFMEV